MNWTPDIDRGTWHPCGRRRWTGPVVFQQREAGVATGLHFTVSRARYRWIMALKWSAQLPIVGSAARRILSRIHVKYEWIWIYNGPRGEA